jgi:hypothetical protein
MFKKYTKTATTKFEQSFLALSKLFFYSQLNRIIDG